MKTKTKNTTTKWIISMMAVAALALTAGCGGGGAVSVATDSLPAAVAQSTDTGDITGTLEDGTAGRVAARSAACSAQGGTVYAIPDETADEQVKPDSTKPKATIGADGAFTIKNVPLGKYKLLFDLKNDGKDLRMLREVQVQKNTSVDTGRRKIDELPFAPCVAGQQQETQSETAVTEPPLPPAETGKNYKTARCDVKLDKVNYAHGETLVMSITGYNNTTEPLKCGVLINLRKGQGHPEKWRSDFNDPATYVVLPANSEGAGTILKVIPNEWPATNSQAGSDYRVYTITENAKKWGRSDNFNIKKECRGQKNGNHDYQQCVMDDDDDDSGTTDPGTEPSTDPGTEPSTDPGTDPGTEPQPSIACYTNADCDDANEYTNDICNNPATPESFCENWDY